MLHPINHLLQLNGVGLRAIRELVAAGYTTLDDLAGATLADLTAVRGIGAATAAAILDVAANGGDGAGDPVQTYRYSDPRAGTGQGLS